MIGIDIQINGNGQDMLLVKYDIGNQYQEIEIRYLQNGMDLVPE